MRHAVPLALLLTLLMATVSYYVLERPALKFKARYARVRSRDA